MRKLLCVVVVMILMMLSLCSLAVADQGMNDEYRRNLLEANVQIGTRIQSLEAEIKGLKERGLQNMGAISMLDRISVDREKAKAELAQEIERVNEKISEKFPGEDLEAKAAYKREQAANDLILSEEDAGPEKG